MAIQNFGDQTSSDVYYSIDSKLARRIPKEIWPVCRRKLTVIHNAQSLQDLRLPGLNLEALNNDRPGFFSVRIDLRYRIIFRFVGGHAYDVTIENYHGRKTS